MKAVFVNGAPWEIIWTTHAKSRTYDRRSHPKIATVNLVKLLGEMDSVVPNFIDELGEVAVVRSFLDMTYYIISPKKDESKIKIITYGDIGTTYPKFGDMVFTIFPNGEVSSVRWHPTCEAGADPHVWGNIMANA